MCRRRTLSFILGKRYISTTRRRVVVTGLGAITPLGPNIETTWQSVLSPGTTGSNGHGITSLKTALEHQNLSPDQFQREWEILLSLSCQVAASVSSDWISHHPDYESTAAQPWNDGRTSRFVQLAMIAAKEAMHRSGLDVWLGNDRQQTNESDATIQQRREGFGVSIGNGMSSTRDISMTSTLLAFQADPSRAHRKLSPHFVPRILPNSPSARVAIQHNLRGPNLSHSEACAAGACAIAHAVELIQSGRAKGMVAGGCESAVEALGLIGFSRLRALSDTTEGSDEGCSEASRPFDETRNGFVLAEGSAMLVLEEYSQAVTRKANILAEVVGIGYSGDAFHITAPEPSGEGAARAMTKAAEDASLANGMNDIDYINAHATSTPVGDVAELNAIRLALLQSESSEQRNNTPLLVSSTKGATGHLLGAAGAIEAALTVSAVSNSTVPPTQNLSKISDEVLMLLHPNDGTRLIHLVKNEPIQKELRYALSNSFGFGGANVSLLFTKCL